MERPPLRPALAEVRGSVRSAAVTSLWSARPWSRPWREQYTLGEGLPEDGDAGRVAHLADEATVTVHLDDPDDPVHPASSRR